MHVRKLMQHVVLAATLSYGAVALAAEPTIDQVYQAAKAGNFGQAQSMMDEVLKAHPNSAKAHFVEAELLARQNKLAEARAELAKAQELKPGLPFENPAKVRQLQAVIDGTGAVRTAPGVPVVQSGLPAANYSAQAPARSSGGGFSLLPIILIFAAIAIGIMAWRASRRNQQQAVYGGYDNPPPSQGFGYNPNVQPGYPPQGYGPGYAPQQGSGLGSRVMGGLATGAALGAGMVAGEALAKGLMGERHHDSGSGFQNDSSGLTPIQPDQSNFDMGGNDFGMNDSSSWDDGGGGGGDWDN
jgi:hypothetical protein